jgi:hypothetical protein
LAGAFHERVGLTETFVAESAGDTSVGAAGGPETVVNKRGAENALAPPALLALTRQKY